MESQEHCFGHTTFELSLEQRCQMRICFWYPNGYLKFKVMVGTRNLNLGAINVLTILKAMGIDESTLRTEKFRRLKGTARKEWVEGRKMRRVIP